MMNTDDGQQEKYKFFTLKWKLKSLLCLGVNHFSEFFPTWKNKKESNEYYNFATKFMQQ